MKVGERERMCVREWVSESLCVEREGWMEEGREEGREREGEGEREGGIERERRGRQREE